MHLGMSVFRSSRKDYFANSAERHALFGAMDNNILHHAKALLGKIIHGNAILEIVPRFRPEPNHGQITP
jgi:hypothetical protein